MQEPAEGRRFLLLSAGDRLAAVEARQVRRILRELPTVPLPGAQPQLLGLAEFAGEPLAVLDLAKVLGAGPGPAPSFPVTVVLWVGPPSRREAVGLRADAALDVVTIPAERIVPGGEGLVVGEAALPQGTAEILDLSRLGSP
ncbi:MAG: chemotaxis protein CheW [Thermoanaerobaculum sp.]|nr:chemotaxis protein CheW [Thermoanaerobaculum sp.]MCX7895494.1 chemotaxis protein CheW [Thermoanaerobaculum sp.]MDW7967367.1 chemotaxis protein CheW [Thermoanaerobaculum sp.]